MKKSLLLLPLVVTFFALWTVSAAAASDDVVKVGLRYGSSAMFSANLENAEGSGYEFGYYDGRREFQSLGWTEETAISMTASGTIYLGENGTYSADMPSGGFRIIGPWHLQLSETFRSFDRALDAAEACGGYPAYIDGEFVVRYGSYKSSGEAEDDLRRLGEDAYAVESSGGVTVTRTRTDTILFEFDSRGETLAVLPDGRGGEAVTWFRGSRYLGGFEYPCGGRSLDVINVLDLEQYVRGVLPSEMSPSWDLEALKAQAVCARTYAVMTTKHGSDGFDLCATTHCQAYSGVGSATASTDRAVEETAGECLYYDGELAQAYYHSSDGGATEDAENVWGTDVPYLRGREDPYEAQISIPNYSWTVTYTWEELTWILQNSGYDIGDVVDAYVSETTDLGNVYSVTFVDSRGNTLVRTGDNARMAFYSTTFGKNVPSLRFTISGGTSGGGSGLAVNSGSNTIASLDGVSVISGGGDRSRLEGERHTAISASGRETVSGGRSSGGHGTASRDGITVTGTGNGHNVGMSQYGARAMAEAGYDYIDILEFYFTGIDVR